MPRDYEVIHLGELTIRILLEGGQCNGSVAMFEFTAPPGARVPVAHSHDGYEETIYGLAGTMTMNLAGQVIPIGPGEVVCIPRGVVHRFDNFGTEAATGLAVITPGVLDLNFFREVAAIVSAAAGGPPDLAAIAATMRRHGLTPAPSFLGGTSA